jgi:4-alpha-glucanotransferase
MRRSGVLLPVTSLPTRGGIGGFSKEAYEFVDRLEEAGQSIWQILPLVPTGFGDSPYQSVSTFAGNPYLISLDELVSDGLLKEEERQVCGESDDPDYIDYARLYLERLPVLRCAFARFREDEAEGYDSFLEENKSWLEDYVLFMAVKNDQGGASWDTWPEALRRRDPQALQEKREALSEEIRFQYFLQYVFDRQWKALKQYANERNIRILGDMPIYVAMDSADAWAAPELFQFNAELTPEQVAGCPPDGFSPDGQLWGNPLYDWEYQKSTQYAWWCLRMKRAQKLYDIIRIDHFRGFESYYSIPFGDKTARGGVWKQGPGLDVFHAIRRECGEVEVIAEDLGYLTAEVREMVHNSGFPGMKVLHFAFGSDAGNEYLPHHYDRNCVVYTGTHDNDTSRGLFANMPEHEKRLCLRYIGEPDCTEEEFAGRLIRLAMASVSDTAIIPMQDYLNLGSEARMNLPATQGGRNWRWRMKPGAFTDELAKQIREMTELYSRLPEPD